MKNLKEFKELIEKYESITEDEIIKKLCEQPEGDLEKALQMITGFGSENTCTLCNGVGYYSDKVDAVFKEANCYLCVYSTMSNGQSCSSGVNSATYYKIHSAETTAELIKAIRERANHMKSIIKDL